MNTPEFSLQEYCAAFLLDFLASVGVVNARLAFNGSGDSGAVDSVDFTFRRNRKPNKARVAEQWRLAVARHHLLYPEYSIKCLEQEQGRDSKLSAMVEGYFYDHISDALGDWVNNEGGGGSVTLDITERLITYRASYNEEKESEPQSGRAEHPVLFGALLAAARPFGVAAIEVELHFDSTGEIWDQECVLAQPDGRPRQLESAQEEALVETCRELVRAHLPAGASPDLTGNFGALFAALYTAFVEPTALAAQEDDTEGFTVSLRLAANEVGPALVWSATFRYMDSGEDDTGEIEAPVIAPVKRSRKRAA